MKCAAFVIPCALYLGCVTLGSAAEQTAPALAPTPQFTSADADRKLVAIIETALAALKQFEEKRSELEAFIIAKHLIPDPPLIPLIMALGDNSWRFKMQDAQRRYHESKGTPVDVLRYHVEVALCLPTYSSAREMELQAFWKQIDTRKDKISVDDLKKVSELANAAWTEYQTFAPTVSDVSSWMLTPDYDQQMDRLFTAASTPPYDKK